MDIKKHKVAATLCGTILEWMDYVLYGYMAHIIAAVFFSAGSTISLLASYGILAGGFMARPLGGLYFGYLSDTYGRQHALVRSIVIMTICTLSLALLPSYKTIGWCAPILLLFCRLGQGFAVGGEFNNAGIYLAELFPKHPIFAGSLNGAAASLGVLLGACISLLVNASTTPHIAFRCAFAMSALGGLVGYWLRKNTGISIQHRTPSLQTIFCDHWRTLAKVFSIAAFMGTYFYVANVYYITFLKTTVGLSSLNANLAIIFAEVLIVFFIPFIGYLCEKKPAQTLYIGIGTCVPTTYLLFSVPYGASWEHILILQTLFAFTYSMICAPSFGLLALWFAPTIRARAVSMSWGLGVALWAGFTPFVAQIFTQKNMPDAIWLLLVASAILVCVTHIPILKKRASTPTL